MSDETKDKTPQNERRLNVTSVGHVRKQQLPGMLFWTLWYAVGFLFASNYYIYDVFVASRAFSAAMIVFHFGVVFGLIAGFGFLRKPLDLVKPYLATAVALAVVFAAIFPFLRENHIFCLCVGAGIGLVGVPTYISFCKQFNNTERLYTVIAAHVFIGVAGVATLYVGRESRAFCIAAAVLYVIAAIICFFEVKPKAVESEEKPLLKFSKKYFAGPILAVVDGFFGVGCAVLLAAETGYVCPDATLFFYLSAIVAAGVFFLVFKKFKRPVSIVLLLSFSLTAVMIVAYLLTSFVAFAWYLVAVTAGVE